MTLICAPVKQIPAHLTVDLYEIVEQGIKKIYDRDWKLCYIDIDYAQSRASHSVPLVVSYHNYESTPSNLEQILYELQAKHPYAAYYKIATYARSTLDSLRMLLFQRQHPNVIGLCMGPKGSITRVLAPVVSSPWTYAPLRDEDRTAPGQLLWKELETIYHFRKLTPKTLICGLIGNPVSHSVGHLFHNDCFYQNGLPAVYVKMDIKSDELASFFDLIKELPLVGLSVTAPLKEAVIPFTRSTSQEVNQIRAVNTLILSHRGWKGFNTDSRAAIRALGRIKGKKVCVLGAGGAARAIVYELVRRKGSVTIVNRTLSKAKELAEEMGCAFSSTVVECDVLINATPHQAPLQNHLLSAKTQVMDISIKPSSLLSAAELVGCEIVDGFPMFFYQALDQQALFISAIRRFFHRS